MVECRGSETETLTSFLAEHPVPFRGYAAGRLEILPKVRPSLLRSLLHCHLLGWMIVGVVTRGMVEAAVVEVVGIPIISGDGLVEVAEITTGAVGTTSGITIIGGDGLVEAATSGIITTVIAGGRQEGTTTSGTTTMLGVAGNRKSLTCFLFSVQFLTNSTSHVLTLHCIFHHLF